MATTERATFYDQHPFDWVSPDSAEEIHAVVSRPLIDLIESLDANSLVFDIGCGPGRVLGFLAHKGIRCIGLDRSRVSVGLAVRRYGRPGAVGDNLHLPFADGSADIVISDGVIHHTEDPLAAFNENYRVLKPGGKMYLAIYKASGRYPVLYKYPGRLIRSGILHAWSRPFVICFFQFPYFLIHVLRSKGRRTWSGVQNLFYDYFVTPRVAFFTRQVVEEWCVKQQARIIRYDENQGQNVHSFLLEKEPRSKNRLVPVKATGDEMFLAAKNETT